MAKSLITLVVIIALISVGTTIGFMHTEKTVEDYTNRLEKVYKNPKPNQLKSISDNWDKDKKTLMLLINHRDVESVSSALIRAYEESAAGRYDMAVEEIAVAKFLLEELVERERFSLENIL